MNKQEIAKRILARGQHSNHCHVVIGEVEFDAQGRSVVGEDSTVVLRHLLETEWVEGREVWTGEHKDISLQPGVYEYVPQMKFDPLTKRIEAARD